MPSLSAKWLFGAAAAYNFSVGLGLLIARPLVAPVLHLDPISGTNLVTFYLAAGLITLFGYAYVRVAVNPVTYRPYILLGLIGKLIAIVVATSVWLVGEAPGTLALLALGDVIFSALFVVFLRQAVEQ